MAVLIDTGFPVQMKDFRVAMEKVGVSFDKLKAVILTHQDVDHIGSLSEILQECGDRVRDLSLHSQYPSDNFLGMIPTNIDWVDDLKEKEFLRWRFNLAGTIAI
ncbi:metallo-beta-lactamase superfamily protein [Brevibacillus brevis]|nr:metallo-beta-lactamase superfamily protein [Brevibacillus brevis]VEF87033.1 Metallo-beta-lactamase superfamily [Brevibacillus brevis]